MGKLPHVNKRVGPSSLKEPVFFLVLEKVNLRVEGGSNWGGSGWKGSNSSGPAEEYNGYQ